MPRGQLQSWVRSVLLGVLIGLPILGGGGRVAMRIIATMTGAPSAFTFEGTLTVLLPLALALFAPVMALFAAVFLVAWRRFAIGLWRVEAAAIAVMALGAPTVAESQMPPPPNTALAPPIVPRE